MNAMILRVNDETGFYDTKALVEISDNTSLSYSVNNLISNELDLVFIHPTLLSNTLLHKDLIQITDILYIYNFGVFIIQNINYELDASNIIRVNASYGFTFDDDIQLPLLNGVYDNAANLINTYFNQFYYIYSPYPITYSIENQTTEFGFFDSDYEWKVYDVYNNFQKQASVVSYLNRELDGFRIEFKINPRPQLIFDLNLASDVNIDVNSDIYTMVNYVQYNPQLEDVGSVVASYSWNETLDEVIDMSLLANKDKHFKPAKLMSILEDVNEEIDTNYQKRALNDLNELPYTINITAVYDISVIKQYNNIENILSELTGNIAELIYRGNITKHSDYDPDPLETTYNIIQVSIEEVSINGSMVTIKFGNSNKTINL